MTSSSSSTTPDDDFGRLSRERRTAMARQPSRRRPGWRRQLIGSGAASSRIVLPLVCLTVDAVLVMLALTAAWILRTHLHVWDNNAGDVGEVLRRLGALMPLTWLVLLALFGTYRPYQFSVGTEEYRNVVNSSVVAAGVIGIYCYLDRYQLPRGFFVLSFVIGIPLLILGRYLQRRVLHAARRRGWFRHRVLVVGDALHIDEITTIMKRESWLGYGIVGALRGAGPAVGERTPTGVRYVGSASTAAESASRLRADVIVVAGGAFTSSVELRRARWALEDERVQVIVVPSVTDVAAERVRVRPMAGLPLVHLERPGDARTQSWAKRCFDVLGAGVVLLLVSPLLLVAVVAIRREGQGPVLFRQFRVGRDGREFPILKFRTMVVGAEDMLPSLAEANESDGVLFKIVDDPRITRSGRWMRRFSVDELPQLVNVLRGDMSLVGPRPALPTEVSRYDTDTTRRLRVRPGITGLWQVSGRSKLSWEDTVRLDLYYVDNWSLLQDLVILLRTVRAVFGRTGAY